MLELGLLDLMLVREVGHDFVDGLDSLCLQLDGDVAGDCFRYSARPIWRPVRREVVSTLGLSLRIASTCWRTGLLGERTSGGIM